MKVVLVCHSLRSCWNHGNAHFLRGMARAMLRRGCEVEVLEPVDGWSRSQLVADHGAGALGLWREAYPELESAFYDPHAADLEAVLAPALDRADLVIVHEWTEPHVIRHLGRLRRRGGSFQLLFHDTHHRAVSEPATMGPALLDGYDGLLAFGAALLERWRLRGWDGPSLVWHEAADVTLFRPRPDIPLERDLVWVGNWGDDERAEELGRFLIEPVARLGLRARVHGVRWPAAALTCLAGAGIDHAGWLPNHRVPEAFAKAAVTLHIPRRPYVEALPGIPTIRVFEALACGIPLVCSPWTDEEGLFPPGCWLTARDDAEMTAKLRMVLNEPGLRRSMAEAGVAAVAARHTTDHRLEELLAFPASLRAPPLEVAA